ncbi:MAG: cation transporter [Prevotellaceae bacterium]|jgi:copper chaperone CopZ|nr:cation transporter [Prevotellaceae bacterium]
MKTTTTFLLCLTMLLGAATAGAQLKPNEAEATFKTSISCNHCKQRLERSIPFEKGVEDMVVNLSDKTVYVKYNSKKTSADHIKKAIEKLGYSAEVISEAKAEEKK